MAGNDPLEQAVAVWKQATDAMLQAWENAYAAGAATPEGEAALAEFRKTSLGTTATLNEATRTTAEPLVAMAGGVPLSEFRRLADQVHTILLRLDRIDDVLSDVRRRLPPPD